MRSAITRQVLPFHLLFLVLAVLACVFLWRQTYDLRDEWPGIPPAPDAARAKLYGFGDVELSYRNIGLLLQNAGDEGGRVTNLRDYNLRIVHDWLWLTYKLNPQANYVPSLAAYYFGATEKHEDVRYLIDYLAKIGEDNGYERWRWLVHAIFLARYGLKDMTLALQLADRLAAVNQPDMPLWTKDMPAFVMSGTGQKKAARDLMLTIAATTKNIDPADINETCYYINKNLREPGDNLEKNSVFQDLCSVVHETEGMREDREAQQAQKH